MSLAAARRRQDDIRRVSFSETRLTSSRLYDSDDDSINERLREEEEERALSERHGEAQDDEGAGNSKNATTNNNKRKVDESEKDIAQALDQEEKKKIKKPRPQLQASNLTDENGLIKLPIEMKRIQYKPKKGKKRDIAAAASYCHNLVTAYQGFCDDLFPSMNFEDVLLKIEQLGAKKEVKDFLQNMRDSVRNDYLERLYGREKADRMLQELDDGLKQQQYAYDEDDFGDIPSEEGPNAHQQAPNASNDSPPRNTDNSDPKLSDSTRQVSPQSITGNTSQPTVNAAGESDNEEAEATFEEEMEANKALEEEMEAKFEEEAAAAEAAMQDSPPPSTPEQSTEKSPGQQMIDDDEEEEATFDDAIRSAGDETSQQETAKENVKDDPIPAQAKPQSTVSEAVAAPTAPTEGEQTSDPHEDKEQAEETRKAEEDNVGKDKDEEPSDSDAP